MQIEITIPDKAKRAIRYMELNPEAVQDMLKEACAQRLSFLIREAKKKFIDAQTMETISPESLG